MMLNGTQFRPFGATNEPGSCLWCGRTLRRKTCPDFSGEVYRAPKSCVKCFSGSPVAPPRRHVDYHVDASFVPVEGGRRFRCTYCDTEQGGTVFYPNKGKRVPAHDKPGDYGDGHFCGLRCAYDFAVHAADNGYRFKPVKAGT